jgi:hypothetical protein
LTLTAERSSLTVVKLDLTEPPKGDSDEEKLAKLLGQLQDARPRRSSACWRSFGGRGRLAAEATS